MDIKQITKLRVTNNVNLTESHYKGNELIIRFYLN